MHEVLAKVYFTEVVPLMLPRHRHTKKNPHAAASSGKIGIEIVFVQINSNYVVPGREFLRAANDFFQIVQ